MDSPWVTERIAYDLKMLLRLHPEEMSTSSLTPTPPTLTAMYLFLMESLSVDYLSYLALSTQMTKLSMTPSSCRPVWRKWITPSTSPH